MLKLNLKDAITTVPNIGDKRAALFHRCGVFTITDLIHYYPRDFKNRTAIRAVSSVKPGETVTVCAMLKKPAENYRINNRIMTRAIVSDDSGTMEMTWFNQPYRKNQLKTGQRYFFTGRTSKKYDRLSISAPETEMEEEGISLMTGRIVPVYVSTARLSQKMIVAALDAVLKDYLPLVKETLPAWILNRYHLDPLSKSIQNIHFPMSNEAYKAARRRLVFEELFLLQCALHKIKYHHQSAAQNTPFTDNGYTQQFLDALPYPLTNAQCKTLLEIQSDLCSSSCMNRLVQGDVGSGKTAVAMAACYLSVQNGFQAVIMAPTEVLAAQHYKSFQTLFEPLGIATGLLIGAMKKKEKDTALARIQSGECQIVVGTHALIQKTVIFNRLGLVIADEQHRFGVKQRLALTEKGDNPNTLIMTATPIPRTLAIILYGDLDISIIDELPPGRKTVRTWAVDVRYRQRIYQFIRKQVDEGRQCYIVCPLVEKSDKSEGMESLLSVNDYFDALLKEPLFKGIQIANLHGRMKAQDKQAIIDAFVVGATKILVATTVIEVGVNVPNATVMLVENAERFGLAQLHQLRGRIGRGSYESHCILIGNPSSENSRKRLKVMSDTNDGFKISELDLKLRGAGDFFGVRQHGLPDLKIANLYQPEDINCLKEAQEAAAALTARDPMLLNPEHFAIHEGIGRLFGDKHGYTVHL